MNLQQIFQQENYQAKGVIHIGGDGAELERYEKMGFKRILFIERDPEVFARVAERIRGKMHVLGVQVHVGDRNGYINIRGPLIPERRLDDLVIELGVHPREFNALVFGVGPHKGMARVLHKGMARVLRGATSCIDRADVIGPNMQGFGFSCLEHTFTAGEFMIRPPVLNLWQEPKHGRFGNELFHYFVARLLAAKHGLQLHTAPWPGKGVFGLNEPPLANPLPVIQEHTQKWEESAIFGTLRNTPMPPSLKNTCVASHFQFHTACWTSKERQIFTSLFQPCEALLLELHRALEAMMGDYHTLVAIHVRRGDYTEDHPTFAYRTPIASYRKWLAEIWPTLNAPLLYVASDDPDVAKEFLDYPQGRLKLNIPEQFYLDFWALTQAEALAISNSSFSFAAAMLNSDAVALGDRAPEAFNRFVRPDKAGIMHAFDPWNDDVLLHRYDAPEFPSTEQQALELLVELLPAVDILRKGLVVEVGLGTFGWFFRSFAVMGYTCTAVEPLPTEALLEAIKKSHDRIHFIAAAVADHTGTVTFYPGRGDDLNSLEETWWGRDATRPPVTVPALTLPDVLDGSAIRNITLLKLDVEGAEPMIIAQLQTLPVGELPLVVMFEYSTTPPTDGKPRDRASLDRAMLCLVMLRDLGYTTGWRLENHRPAETLNVKDLKLSGEVDDVFPSDVDYGNFILCRPAGNSFAPPIAHAATVSAPIP